MFEGWSSRGPPRLDPLDHRFSSPSFNPPLGSVVYFASSLLSLPSFRLIRETMWSIFEAGRRSSDITRSSQVPVSPLEPTRSTTIERKFRAKKERACARDVPCDDRRARLTSRIFSVIRTALFRVFWHRLGTHSTRVVLATVSVSLSIRTRDLTMERVYLFTARGRG